MGMTTAVKNHQDHQDRQPEVARKTCGPRSKEPRWGSLGTRGNRYRRSMGLATFPTTSERLKRATRKSTMLRGAINKVKKNFSNRNFDQPILLNHIYWRYDTTKLKYKLCIWYIFMCPCCGNNSSSLTLPEEKLLANWGLIFAGRRWKQGTKEQRPTGTSRRTANKH